MTARKLPSGVWQETVRHPSGKRVTRTAKLKGTVEAWAREEKSRIARGEWRDPSAGRMSYVDWRDKWLAARVVEDETMRGDLGILRNHMDRAWEGYRLGAISRLDVQAWVRQMQKDGAGPATVRRAYNLLTTMLGDAVTEGLLSESPCRRIDLPANPPGLPKWFTREQVDAIREHLPERHSIATELMVYSGLRWGEMAGLRISDVDWLRRRISVQGAAKQSGAWKPYPKSSKSRRELPVPPHVMEMLSTLVAGRPDTDRLFVNVRPYRGTCSPWSGSNWRKVWDAAVEAAGVPAYSPHALRHTTASWLAQEGVSLYEVQEFLGHESAQTTQRYAHLRPGAYSAVELAWEKLVTHVRRMNPTSGTGTTL